MTVIDTVGQAGQYDELYGARQLDLMRQDRPTLTLAYLAEAGFLDGRETLLDIGTGVGKDPRTAVIHYGFEMAVGLDTSAKAVLDANTLTQLNVPEGARDKIRFVRGEIGPFAETHVGTFDLITATSVIHLMRSSDSHVLMEQARGLLTPGRGLFAVATKTLNSGDRRPVSEGGKSQQLLAERDGRALHLCDDGLLRQYFDPTRVEQDLREAGFRTIDTQVVTGQYGSVEDCEFVIAVAQ